MQRGAGTEDKGENSQCNLTPLVNKRDKSHCWLPLFFMFFPAEGPCFGTRLSGSLSFLGVTFASISKYRVVSLGCTKQQGKGGRRIRRRRENTAFRRSVCHLFVCNGPKQPCRILLLSSCCQMSDKRVFVVPPFCFIGDIIYHKSVNMSDRRLGWLYHSYYHDKPDEIVLVY